MEITQEIRRGTSTSLSEVQKMLYGNPIYGLKLYDIAIKNNLADDTQYENFAAVVGDIILGFYKIEDTVPLLQQELGIDARTAALLGADVLDFLAPLSDPNFVVPKENFSDEIIPLTEPVITTPATSYAAVQNQVYAPVTTVPELHTMATDAGVARASYQPMAQPEPTYSSEQPVMRRPLSDLPSYANGSVPQSPNSTATPPIEPPRWG